MTNIEKIRQEIERLYDSEAPKHDQQCDFDDGYFTGIAVVSKFIDSLSDEKLSLPDNLDEAAEEYRRESFKKSVIPQIDGPVSEYGGSIKDAFITGAEWMAEQGLVSEGIIYQTSGEDTKIELNEYIGYLEDCEKVIVNIRKKEENYD